MSMMSVKQFAEGFGVETQTVRKAIMEKRIKAERVGSFYVIPKDEFDRLRARGHFRRERGVEAKSEQI